MTPWFEAFLHGLSPDLFEPGRPDLSRVFEGRAEVPADVFPDSYLAFLRIVGPRAWRNDSGIVLTPGEAYTFDSDCWEAEGLVAIVENADGVGDYIAVNPADPAVDGERPVYYCGHDPTSVVPAADSFEAWVRESAEAPAKRGMRYWHLQDARFASYARYRAWEKQQRNAARGPKRWWEFWR